MQDPLLGKVVGGRFSLVKGIGQGIGSSVYQAYDLTQEGKAVAVKVVKGQESDEVLQEFFSREVASLQLLRHPNIIRLLDSGTHESNRWLALELAEQGSLSRPENKSRHRSEPALLKLLGECAAALQHAHMEQVIHRDIKPSNILFDQEGTTKLADFNISKALGRNWGSRTLRAFMTPKYAAPEQRDGAPASEASDIYSLGVVIAELMAGAKDDEEASAFVPRALELAGFSGPLRGLLRRMTLNSPASRLTASLVLAELADIVSSQISYQTIYARLTQKAANQLLDHQGGLTSAELSALVERDLRAPIAVDDSRGSALESDEEYLALGERFTYLLRPDAATDGERQHLVIIGVGSLPPLLADERRATAMGLDAEIDVVLHASEVPPNDCLARFRNLFAVELSQKRARIAESRRRYSLLDQWDAYVELAKSATSGNEVVGSIAAITYLEEQGLFRVELTEEHALDQIGASSTPRMVSVQTTDGRGLPIGMIVEVDGAIAMVRPHEATPEHAFGAGSRLVIDVPSEVLVYDKQERALRALRNNQTVRADLLDILSRPEGVQVPTPVRITLLHTELDESNKAAIELALGADSLVLIQGPPGTGKTTVIAELVGQILNREARARVLLTSQSNVAVDNVLDRLATLVPRLDAVRIGITDKIDAASRRFELSQRMQGVRAELLAKAELARERFRRLTGMTPTDAAALRNLIRDEVKKGSHEGLTAAHELAADVFGSSVPTNPDEVVAYLTAAERVTAALPEVVQQVSELQEQWADLLGSTKGFERPLLRKTRVVAGTCIGFVSNRVAADLDYDWVIVDEAARATPPETLVPLIRGKRFVLVGDHRQLPPVLEEEAALAALERLGGGDKSEMQVSLFEFLFRGAPEAARRTLVRQYRMHPEIGSLVGETFYDGKLENGVAADQRSLGATLLGAPLLWLDTSNAGNADEQRVGYSFRNSFEAGLITKRLVTLDRKAEKARVRPTVGIITGYIAQRDLLESRLRARGEEGFSNLAVSVLTVDESQGKQFDLVFYSAVRSNPRHEIGFLRDERRLNVALSRARHGLVIVGNRACLGAARVRSAVNPFLSVHAYFSKKPSSRILESVGNA